MNRRDALLWGGILTPPLIWFVCECADFAAAPLACSSQGIVPLHAITLTAIVLTAGITVMAARAWLRLRNTPDSEGVAAGRATDMALAAFVLSAGFLLVQTALLLPNFLLAGCE